ncbi:MAG: MBL fold metallo-hydrolase [Actinomycetota bacterium]|nr:MBL fold metallo-hydrolase [Actinomycetota bacterium]
MTSSVRWLGHATAVIDLEGVRLLTDPLLRRHAGLLRRITATPSPADYAHTDAVLLSHLHLDHADLPSLRLLGPVPVLASGAVAAWLRDKGIDGRTLSTQWQPVSQVASWEEKLEGVGQGAGAVLAQDAVEVRLVHAEHHSRPMPHRPDDAHGFLVRSPEVVVWFAGDTAAYPDMEQLDELAGRPVDVALLPIHGWGPRLSPGHLDPSGAADVCRRLGVPYVVPIHHGTLHPLGFHLGPLGWVRRPMQTFREEVAARSPRTTVVELTPDGPPWTFRPCPGG